VLLALVSRLDAQSVEAASISPLRAIFSWACGHTDESGPKFELLWQPLARPSGLNLGSGCMPARQTYFLQIDPRSLVTIPDGPSALHPLGTGCHQG
jgi:hypothetical protein